MSTFLSAKIRNLRDQAPPAPQPSGDITAYIEAVTQLVPAEVLALHAAVLSFTTTTKDSATTISEAGPLRVAFWAMIVLSVGLWWAGRIGQRAKPLDAARMFIPPIAFVTWTALQPVSAFDAVWPLAPFAWRMVGALIAVVVLVASAGLLAKSDK